METKVIVPSAKIVPEELRKIGKLPGVIYPINQKTMFDYLYEEYRDCCSEMDIICYEEANKVQRQLEKYRDANVNIRCLPYLSDLGHTVYFGMANTVGSVVINFADTIVMNAAKIVERGVDSFFCQEDYMSEKWTYFDEKDGVITDIYDKKAVDCDVKKRLFTGVFLILDSEYFRGCLEDAFRDECQEMDSFYCALQKYSWTHPMRAEYTTEWFDIGHADRYYNSKLAVKAREFNHISIDKNRGILRKSSDEKDKFIGEIRWYLKLPSDMEYVSPRIFDYSTAYDNPYISMEYYAYHTVHELFLYGELGLQQWEEVFSRIRFVCRDFRKYSVRGDAIATSLEDMYYTKTIRRLDCLRTDEHFRYFFERPITVNGRQYCSLQRVADILRQCIPEMLYDVDTFHIIHGDLCFANIMVDSNLSFIKLIDPRGRFGAYDIYGDVRYELAKLFHSVEGKYDFIIKNLMDVTYDLEQAEIKYVTYDRSRASDVCNVFKKVFENEIGDDLDKIELIEALLFLSMIPLHGENLEHQMAMLGTGLELLDKVTRIEM